MDKIWIVYSKGSYKKKFRIFKKESDVVKNISDNPNLTIMEYDLKSSVIASEYLKSKDRDNQLRTILGELSDYEVNASKLIELYEVVGKDARWYRKNNVSFELKKLVNDKKSFSSYLVRHKKYFFQIDDSFEWILSILKCHNFQDYLYDSPKWDSASKSYIVTDTASDTLKENFKLAKAELKKKNKVK